ncbi:osmoprotectant ABC transporter substrate-binding protein [Terribacillus saccharophilus]|uniref:Osmoprotectant ABC transporter substrate-binding protein n=1 Tax=Terribacillus saccharophilus TaxID=361277 RepID=A0ABX4GVT1_9BACI|nr:osmoprotectant ABC transporter substrate-binding protein [Terribacillus saccharophilus]PAD34632.1 osmoprotectant ABC transporter substrate-binding protein [Terribacillus saccharophilus]PAD95380.1 osmoprotectant ABC transporter substrate-binding protein [Terribacillus saccharophilus]PAD98958.1 osmoprotectant ABC transporter substrate-binding protein [Terribacillus saccharophilus]
MKKRIKLVLVGMMTAFLLSGCSLPGLGGSSADTIKIGTVTTSETQTLGYIQKYMIEHYTDLHAEIVGNLGSSIVMHQAMVNGDVDISAARYTGTDLSGALHMDLVNDPDEAMAIVQREFEEQFDQKWFDTYGFDNTYVLSVRQDVADEEGLEKVSDLKSVADKYQFGVDNSWINREGIGYDEFVKGYGFEFNKVYPMQIGLVYSALNSGKMDAVLAYSTDARLKQFNLATLEDDKHFFPPYDASPVATNEVLREHPEIDDILQKMVGKFNNETIVELNYQADIEKKEPSTVAREYLEEHNYFEDN